jgi:hypothetical protein
MRDLSVMPFQRAVPIAPSAQGCREKGKVCAYQLDAHEVVDHPDGRAEGEGAAHRGELLIPKARIKFDLLDPPRAAALERDRYLDLRIDGAMREKQRALALMSSVARGHGLLR